MKTWNAKRPQKTKFLSRVRVHNTPYNRQRRNIIFKGSRISTRRKSPLTTEATCLTVTFEPPCSVIKLKWKFEVLTMITVKVPAVWNVKSCSLWTRTFEKSVQCTCQNKRDHMKRREEKSRNNWSCRVNIMGLSSVYIKWSDNLTASFETYQMRLSIPRRTPRHFNKNEESLSHIRNFQYITPVRHITEYDSSPPPDRLGATSLLLCYCPELFKLIFSIYF
jgi:hypothetical protein